LPIVVHFFRTLKVRFKWRMSALNNSPRGINLTGERLYKSTMKPATFRFAAPNILLNTTFAIKDTWACNRDHNRYRNAKVFYDTFFVYERWEFPNCTNSFLVRLKWGKNEQNFEKKLKNLALNKIYYFKLCLETKFYHITV